MTVVDIGDLIGQSFEDLDETIHQKVRLGIMSALVARGVSDFRFLKKALGLTDGNLSIHLARLEEAGYLNVHKEFLHKKPHTSYEASEEGKIAFDRYLNALERIVLSGRRGK
jgi:DNA-binding HxlR family transcriptional regulator